MSQKISSNTCLLTASPYKMLHSRPLPLDKFLSYQAKHPLTHFLFTHRQPSQNGSVSKMEEIRGVL